MDVGGKRPAAAGYRTSTASGAQVSSIRRGWYAAALTPACDLLIDTAMSHADDGRLAPPSGADAAATERSRRLHEQFETYYAVRERRRLTTEAWERRKAVRALDAESHRSLR